MATAVSRRLVCNVNPELDGRLEYTISRDSNNTDYVKIHFTPGLILHNTYPGGSAWRYNRWAACVDIYVNGRWKNVVYNQQIKDMNIGQILNSTWYQSTSGEIREYIPDEGDVQVRVYFGDTGYSSGWDNFQDSGIDPNSKYYGSIHTPENHSKVQKKEPNKSWEKTVYPRKTTDRGNTWTKCDAYYTSNWGATWTKIN